MIRGYHIIIHTDHVNLLYKKLPNQRMLRWRLLLEDFNPTVKHIAGEKNLSADVLLRLEMTYKDHNLIKWEPLKEKLKYINNDPNNELVMWMNSLEFEPGCNDKFHYELTEETEIVDDTWPLSISRMKQDQLNNNEFQ